MHASDSTDLSLLQRIAARDTAALAELYDRHSRLLFGLILRIVRDRGEAEEILQEAFVRVWTRAEMYDARMGGPLPWIGAGGAQRRDRSPAGPAGPRRRGHARDRPGRSRGHSARHRHPDARRQPYWIPRGGGR